MMVLSYHLHITAARISNETNFKGEIMQIELGKSILEAVRYETLRDLVLDTRTRYPSNDAFVFRKRPTDAEIHKTFTDFVNDVECISSGLASLGLAEEHISVIGENSYEWIVSYSAVVGGGGVGVPLDRLLPEMEVVSLLRRGKVKAVFYHPKHHEMMVSIAAKAKKENLAVQLYICMDPSILEEKMPKDPHFMDFYDLLQKGKDMMDKGDRHYQTVVIDPEAVRILLFTSGTTAMSKGVMLSHHNICANVYCITSSISLYPGERAFSVLPLHHTFENTCDFVLMSRGVTICFSDGLRHLTKNIQEWHVEVMISVPLLFETVHRKIKEGIEEAGKGTMIAIAVPVTRFLKRLHIDIRRVLFADIIKKLGGHIRLVVIGGAGIDKSIIKDFNDFGIDFLMGYGLTETSPVISAALPDCKAYGSVGRPLTNIEAAIDTDSPKRGTIGEILSRSECVMHGYYENQEATDEVIQKDGWFHTGDMGYMDKKGNIFITGRVKSMIVLTNGKKAFPEEIESLINLIPGVRESFVWGEESERDAIDICAKILIDRQEIGKHLPIPEKTPGDLSLQAYFQNHIKEINHQMPSYKGIRYFVLSEGEMIKTTTMKLKRKQELESIHAILLKTGATLKTANGQNLDTL
jgi:long-chain acyl-CoA synthetase